MTATEFHKFKFTTQDQLTYDEYDKVIDNLTPDKKLLFNNTKELIIQKLILNVRDASYSPEEYEIFQTLSRTEVYCLCHYAGLISEKIKKKLKERKLDTCIMILMLEDL